MFVSLESQAYRQVFYPDSGYYLHPCRKVGSGITRHGIRIRIFFRDHGSSITIFWDRGPTFPTLLESRMRNLVTKTRSPMKKHTSLRSCENTILSHVTMDDILTCNYSYEIKSPSCIFGASGSNTIANQQRFL